MNLMIAETGVDSTRISPDSCSSKSPGTIMVISFVKRVVQSKHLWKADSEHTVTGFRILDIGITLHYTAEVV